MIRIFFVTLLFTLGLSLAHAEGRSKEWALYTWIEEGRWHYSLVRGTEQHPDGTEVKNSATESLEGIKTRLSLLDHGSTVEINPLPVLNMEMHLPPGNTLKEFERVCTGSQLKLLR